jgi:hypothetical protein
VDFRYVTPSVRTPEDGDDLLNPDAVVWRGRCEPSCPFLGVTSLFRHVAGDESEPVVPNATPARRQQMVVVLHVELPEVDGDPAIPNTGTLRRLPLI